MNRNKMAKKLKPKTFILKSVEEIILISTLLKHMTHFFFIT